MSVPAAVCVAEAIEAVLADAVPDAVKEPSAIACVPLEESVKVGELVAVPLPVTEGVPDTEAPGDAVGETV